MKARLMFPARDFDPEAQPPAGIADLVQDLEMESLFAAMADGDKFLGEIAHKVVLTGFRNDRDTIRHRQDVLDDCIAHENLIRTLYELAMAPLEVLRKNLFFGLTSRHPEITLSGAVRLLQGLRGVIGQLADFATHHAETFRASGLRRLCAVLMRELDSDYLAMVDQHLAQLHFRSGVLFSASLGPGNKGQDYVLRHFVPRRWGWLKDLLQSGPPSYHFAIDPRDEAGGRALSELRDEALAETAQTMAQVCDHILDFFAMLRAELGFYIGCLNLRAHLATKRAPMCQPEIAPPGEQWLEFTDLRDPCLSLAIEGEVVGNDCAADHAAFVMITGANQGGKSTFLRSIGLAQMMMQAGMFVTARRFSADLRDGVFTHYHRREDPGLNSGKFDEELRRMNRIVDRAGRAPLFLFNESFAATNEREGSEIARQIVTALIETGARVIFVTHMYAFAEAYMKTNKVTVRFLRAEREADGRRSFRILPGEPLSTSFGRDLYRQIFGEDGNDPQSMGIAP
ncbi:DNA mismatch repair protein MutS [Acidiphilium sp. AL]|uniref:DNA mismatch repair protein MutS n=1 Tax=Acidiphilium iwatense TaxID=768198 RepID=A0ABS9DWN4_9PROT|nr:MULTISPECIES: DNA mismatch repair protein MutS [Acidiphilium]MCF3946106.1 DNA mismatch repair protein MutS [Acidiphilium iwatense]MCU4160976.1 DNA mismatch repair protein MutS [Acidiphilium sp. AL]